jgi:hypothetical protein
MSKELDPTPEERDALAVARQKQDYKPSTVLLPKRGKHLPVAMPSWGKWHNGSGIPFDPNLGNRVLDQALGGYHGNRADD